MCPKPIQSFLAIEKDILISSLTFCRQQLFTTRQELASVEEQLSSGEVAVLEEVEPGYVRVTSEAMRHFCALRFKLADLEANELRITSRLAILHQGALTSPTTSQETMITSLDGDSTKSVSDSRSNSPTFQRVDGVWELDKWTEEEEPQCYNRDCLTHLFRRIISNFKCFK